MLPHLCVHTCRNLVCSLEDLGKGKQHITPPSLTPEALLCVTIIWMRDGPWCNASGKRAKCLCLICTFRVLSNNTVTISADSCNWIFISDETSVALRVKSSVLSLG